MAGPGLLPALIKSLEDAFGLSHTIMGIVVSLGMAAMAGGSVVSGFWFDRSTARRVLVCGTGLYAVSALALFSAQRVWLFVGVMLALQFSNGLTQAIHVVVGRLYAERRSTGLSLAHGLTGAGMLVAPLLVMFVIRVSGGWRASFLISAAVFAAWFLLFILVFREPPAPEQTSGSDHELVMPRRQVLIGLTALACGSALELPLLSWLPTCLESEIGFSKSAALTHLAFVMMGYTAVRLFLGLRHRRIRPVFVGAGWVLMCLCLLALFSFGLRMGFAAYLLGFVIGMCFGPYWPTMAAMLYDVTPHSHGRLTGLLVVASTAGAFVSVSATGWLGDMVGLRYALIGPLFCAALYCGLYGMMDRGTRTSEALTPA